MNDTTRNRKQNRNMQTTDLMIRDHCARDAAFFTEAFTDPVTRHTYDIPSDIKRLATRLCRSYGISGLCDPMYIANVIAVEMGRGDGFSNFAQARTEEAQP